MPRPYKFQNTRTHTHTPFTPVSSRYKHTLFSSSTSFITSNSTKTFHLSPFFRFFSVSLGFLYVYRLSGTDWSTGFGDIQTQSVNRHATSWLQVLK
ncbi:hypothetical protein L6452_00757 [Arctium lappa]|uniref:Uncharacterized protein n=1 Tax=Arctium lappa TaxID=4217 RepID=A0ACB9FFE7_ARCLA|nr:hypothetical protein L6452_00757 [Arctium lappa]